jgi:hypothetical protein
MLILFLKSRSSEPEEQIPLPKKLRLIFTQRVKEAEDDQDRARAERDLAKLQSGAPAE